jgi:arsenite-transporting ATPase
MVNDSVYTGSERGGITMFTGKGGVGKTTCAAATALHYAALGDKTLAISTDATPSLSHVYQINSHVKPAKVEELLYVNELGVEEVKEMWDKKFGQDVYQVFSSFVAIDYPEFVEFMTSILPGLSDEFTLDYIRELHINDEFQTVIWDTAPMGQTLALLKTPAMLGEHLRMAPRIYSKLKTGQGSREPILDIIKRWEKLSAINMDFLQNNVRFVMVTIAEALAVEQLDVIFNELGEYDLKLNKLIINNVVKDESSEFLQTKANQQKKYINHIYNKYPDLDIIELPMFPYELQGLDRLREVEKILFQ